MPERDYRERAAVRLMEAVYNLPFEVDEVTVSFVSGRRYFVTVAERGEPGRGETEVSPEDIGGVQDTHTPFGGSDPLFGED